jgi:acyl carrier protein
LFEEVKVKAAPLRGIFHAAMVLDDGLLTQLTPQRFSRVMSPKVSGAWNLHEASKDLRLDCFVMFSSVSALTGAAGQANYAAANSFLDAMAHYRRSLGLPALTVNWGALSGVGYLVRNVKVAEHLSAHGVHGISQAQATDALGRLLQREITQIGFMRIDWNKVFDAATASPKYSQVCETQDKEQSSDKRPVRELILGTPEDKRLALIATLVSESAAAVLRTSVRSLDANRLLMEMGLDSLMAFELLNRLETQFGILLPNNKISSDSTISGLAAIVLDCLGLDAEKPGTAKFEASGNVRVASTIKAPETRNEQALVILRPDGSGDPFFLGVCRP